MTLKMGVKMIPKRDQKPDTDRQLLYRERDRLEKREGIMAVFCYHNSFYIVWSQEIILANCCPLCEVSGSQGMAKIFYVSEGPSYKYLYYLLIHGKF